MEEIIEQVEPSKNGKQKDTSDMKKAAEWISNIIDSCKHPFHLAGAKKLIVFFKEMYGEKHGAKILYENLSVKLIERMDMIHFD